MRQAAEVLLRRRCEGDGPDAGGQRRDDVHDHRGRVDGQAARDVEAHACDRDPVLAHDGALAEFDVDVRRALRVGEAAGPPDGFLEGGAYRRVQAVQGCAQRLGRDARVGLLHAVERQRQLTERVKAPGADGGDDVQDLFLGIRPGAGLRARNGGAEPGEGQPLAAHVHGAEVDGGGNRGHGAVRSKGHAIILRALPRNPGAVTRRTPSVAAQSPRHGVSA